uniref:Coiled-coil domain-containing protein 86 n=1 Tax=Panagrolaimus sp. JU765 TaxID=591449 RepID=A0AC34PYZ0_9BILA
MSESMEISTPTDVTDKKEPRGKWKSGRWWKEPAKRENRLEGIIKSSKMKSSWDEKMKSKALNGQFKAQQQEIKDKIAAEKQAKIQAMKERRERRKANELKSEVVQVIQIKDKIAAEKQAKIQAMKERRERRKANELKSEVVQVIRNTAKLKKTKKKHLRNIEKRDTTKM